MNKTFEIKLTLTMPEEVANGEVVMFRENIGFNSFELLGCCEQIQLEILEMMSGKLKPTIVERKYVKPTKTKKND